MFAFIHVKFLLMVCITGTSKLKMASILLISLTITTTENDRLNVCIEIHNFFE